MAKKRVTKSFSGAASTTIGVAGLKTKGISRKLKLEISQHFSKVESVQAVFASVDESGVVHVCSIAPDFDDKLYEALLPQERAVERKFPATTFEFHVRARQDRNLGLVAPFGSQPIFVR